MKTIRELEARLQAILGEMRAIDTEAGETRFTEDQQSRWTPLDTERAAVEAELVRARAEAESRRAVVTAQATKGHTERGDGSEGLQVMKRVTAFDGEGVRSLSIGEARDKALKGLEERAKYTLDARQVDDLERRINKDTDVARRLLVTESDDYRSGWKKLVTKSQPILTAEEGRALLAYEEYRAMSEGTNASGGFGIPVKLAA